uniref:DUF3778 domain-containing protein n=1 Tax=Oryza barthii TaxID=65489 RepID=A0A0D3F5A5_9ORYZ
MGTSWLASLWLSSPSVALALVVASAGVGVCAALDGVAVVTSRTPVTCSALAGAIPGADSSSVGGSGWLVVNILLQADAFRILVNGCLFCSESCGSRLQVALFLAIPALIARHKSIGSLSRASLLMVGWSTNEPRSCAISVEATEGDQRFVKRCALQLRPKVAVVAVLRHRGSVSHHGSTAAPCRLAPFSAVWSHLEGFRSSVNPISSGLSLMLTVSILCCVLGFIP